MARSGTDVLERDLSMHGSPEARRSLAIGGGRELSGTHPNADGSPRETLRARPPDFGEPRSVLHFGPSAPDSSCCAGKKPRREASGDRGPRPVHELLTAPTRGIYIPILRFPASLIEPKTMARATLVSEEAR